MIETKPAVQSLTIQSGSVMWLAALSDVIANGFTLTNELTLMTATIAFGGVLWGRWRASKPLSLTGAPKSA